LLATAFGALAAVAGGACLPELDPLGPEPSADEGGPLPFVGCGDGVIATLDDGGDAGESCDPGAIDAQVPGCRGCQLECEGVLDPTSGHCYFAGSNVEYSAATSYCQGKGAHLLTLASLKEADLVKRLVPDGGDVAGYWVGLSRLPALGEAYGPSRAEEPGFPYPPAGGFAAGPCEGCFGLGADAGVFPLEEEELDASSASNAQCIAARGGAWFQVACNRGTTRTTICEREPAGRRAQDCIGGFCFTLASTAKVKRYLVVVSAAGPDEAAQTCAGLDGGSLVVLDSAEEREQLAHEILGRDPGAVEQQLWIGLAADGGVWAWEDGVPATADAGRPLPWGHAQPVASGAGRAFMRLHALAYDTQLAYADDGGKAPRLYVCQRPP
jgi:hypothetical protein